MDFDLNIGDEALSHMKIEDAIRELISNAIDEHTDNKITKSITIERKNKTWILKDYGRGIKDEHFKIQQNKDKLRCPNIIGMFGFGLKDAIAILFSNNIDLKIVTKKKIFTPELRCKNDSNIKTIHMNIQKNTTIDIEGNCGTEIHLKNLKEKYIEKAKSKFLDFLQPEYLYENGNNKIFKLPHKQSIFVNGVEVYSNSGFHFSYNIEPDNKLKFGFNRDRKQIDKNLLKKYIESILIKLNIFDNEEVINEELFDYIIDILAYDNSDKLQEFSSIKILRNLISNINDTNCYVFVGKKDKYKKYLKAIQEDDCEIFILGDAIKNKFKVNHIKDLNNVKIFYTPKDSEGNVTPINTVLNYVATIKQKEKLIKHKVEKAIDSIEQHIKIPENLKNKLKNTSIDESLEDNDYDFSNSLTVSENISDTKLAGILFQYVLEKLNEKNDKDFMIHKMGELLVSNCKKSFLGLW